MINTKVGDKKDRQRQTYFTKKEDAELVKLAKPYGSFANFLRQVVLEKLEKLNKK